MQKKAQFELHKHNVLYKQKMSDPKLKEAIIKSQAVCIADAFLILKDEEYLLYYAYNVFDRLNLNPTQEAIESLLSTMNSRANALKDDPNPESRRGKLMTTAKEILEDLLQKQETLDREPAPPAVSQPADYKSFIGASKSTEYHLQPK